jgi:transketolase
MMSAASLARRARHLVIEHAYAAEVGHIGSALSIVDLLAALYAGVLRFDRGDDRDRFVLSKGHGALALYAVLTAAGLLDPTELATYCTDGSTIATHPEHATRYVDFSTGSLGQGLSVAAGSALAARLDRSSRRAFALLSDAELDEGATWEAALWAGHSRLDGLTAIIDVNGQQALGYTADVLDLEPIADKFLAFQWAVSEVDGHDTVALMRALSARGERPTAVVARTTFGSGVSFMERSLEWHYRPLDESQYETAIQELDAPSDRG